MIGMAADAMELYLLAFVRDHAVTVMLLMF
jgi:hypothetical protein